MTASGGVRGEVGGGLQGPDRRAHRPPAHRRRDGRLELVGDVVVAANHRLGPMPGAPVGLVVQHGGEGGVRGLAAVQGRGVQDRGPDERVAEPRARADEREQPGVDGGREVLGGDGRVQPGGRGQDLRQLVAGGDGGDEQEVARRGRQRGGPAGEGAFEPGGQRQRPAGRRSVARRRHGPGQLHQCQRVADGLAQHPRPVERPQAGPVRHHQPPGGGVVEPRELHRRQPDVRERTRVTRPHGPDHDERGLVGAAGHERDGLLGLLVQPLHVVGEDRHRTGGGERGQEGQRRQGDQERLRTDPLGHPEGRQQGVPLARGQRVHLT